jgi:hypothetical protein
LTIPIVRRWQEGQRQTAPHLVFETNLDLIVYRLVLGQAPRL